MKAYTLYTHCIVFDVTGLLRANKFTWAQCNAPCILRKTIYIGISFYLKAVRYSQHHICVTWFSGIRKKPWNHLRKAVAAMTKNKITSTKIPPHTKHTNTHQKWFSALLFRATFSTMNVLDTLSCEPCLVLHSYALESMYTTYSLIDRWQTKKKKQEKQKPKWPSQITLTVTLIKQQQQLQQQHFRSAYRI